MTNRLSRRRSALTNCIALLGGIALAVSGTAVAQAAGPIRTAITDPQTVVSLTFDDSNVDQLTAVDIMNGHGMKGTFFTTTGWVGSPGYLTQANLTSIAAAGHEIGGHTVTHPDLTTVSASTATQEVCHNRATLASWGFTVTSFAYPFAAVNSATESIVSGCGYNSARGLGDIETRFGCSGCPLAESFTPADPFVTQAPDEVDSTWTLADLQTTVTNAENSGGGWIELTFHHICDGGCDSLAVTPALFQQFTDWLAPRAAAENTVVKTVDQVIGGAPKAIVDSTPAAPGPGVNGLKNPSLETPGAGGIPQCWATGGFGTNTPTYGTITPGHTGAVAEQLTVTGYSSGDAKLLTTFDLGDCAPTVTPGHTYSLGAWYTATQATQFDVYLRDSVGVWTYWTSSPYFAATTAYSHAVWQTPAIPVDRTGISFGLNLFTNGQLVTDDYALYDSVGAPADLTTGIASIGGTAKVGEILTASPGTWAPATTTFTYQWLAGGVAIAGATGVTYSPLNGDIGKAITVQVTGSAPGYLPSTVTSAATPPVLKGPITVTRLAGDDRFATAVQASQAYAPGVQRLYVANAFGFADALSASPAAAHFNSPLLLTAANQVPSAVLAEITRLAPAQIVLVGGTGVASDTVRAQLQAIAPTTRVSGDDRYATSRAIALNAFGTTASSAYLATGSDFPDALTASPAAAHFTGPVILVKGDASGLDPATTDVLSTLNVTAVKIAGGAAIVSAGIENDAKTLFGAANVKRNAGVDRYATAAAINLDAFTTSGTVYLAVGTGFADALVGAALAGRDNAPLYLTPSSCLTASAVAAIDRLGTTKVVLLGGVAVLGINVFNLQACS